MNNKKNNNIFNINIRRFKTILLNHLQNHLLNNHIQQEIYIYIYIYLYYLLYDHIT